MYSEDHISWKIFSTAQWQICEILVKLLHPLEQISSQLCQENSCVSDVLPAIQVLKKCLEAVDVHSLIRGNSCSVNYPLATFSINDSNFQHVEQVKDTLLHSLETRFLNMEPVYIAATALDPRYKLLFFSTPFIANKAKEIVATYYTEQLSRNADTDSDHSSKRARTTVSCSNTSNSVWDYFDDIAFAAPSQTSNIDDEITNYFSAGVILRNENPLLWWYNNRDKFKVLSTFARRFLSAPATSIASERLFSKAQRVYDRRHCISSKNAEMNLFIQCNLMKFEQH